MASYRGLGVQVRPQRQQRPAGVALLAIVGVLGSLLGLLVALAGLWMVIRVSLAPSRQFGMYSTAAVVALIVMWINWGFWEMVKSSWWANLGLMIVGSGLSLWGLRMVPELGDLIGRLVPALSANRNLAAMVLLLGVLVYHLCAIVYTLMMHAAFKVGVKDERPLWEKVHRN
jgi:hypothetical protein